MGPLLKGLASHHAGLLPGWKGLVEGLFQQGACPSSFHSEGHRVKRVGAQLLTFITPS